MVKDVADKQKKVYQNLITFALMNLCIGTHTFPWAFGAQDPPLRMTLEQLMDKAVELECFGIQIADNYPLHELSESQLTAVIEYAQVKRLQLEVGCRGLIKHQVLEYLMIAQKIGAKFVRVVIDLHETFQPSKDQVIGIIKELLPSFEKAGVVLALENHDRFAAKELADIIQCTSDRWVGICLDTANSIGAGEGINEVLSHLAKYTINLHVKDLVFNRLSHQMGFIIQGAVAGSGELDIPHIIARVKQYGKLESILVEVWSDPLANETATIEREAQWAEESVRYLLGLSDD